MSNECSDDRHTLKSQQVELRWDKACSDSYYYHTSQHLEALVGVMHSLVMARDNLLKLIYLSIY